VKRIFILPLLTISVAIAGCGGREARPVSITNPGDSGFDCPGIWREYTANERQILLTLKEYRPRCHWGFAVHSAVLYGSQISGKSRSRRIAQP